MRKGLLLLILLTTALFYSCSKGDDFSSESINFSPYFGKATKAGGSLVNGNAFADGAQIGVFAYYTDEGRYSATASVPNFMYNQLLSYAKATDAWTYSPIKYWPNEATDYLTFWGYYPYNAAGLTLTTDAGATTRFSNTSTGLPFGSFTVNGDPASQVDLMFSDVDLNMSKPTITDKVLLKFHHALSQISFTSKNSDPSAGTLTIKSITISGVKGKGVCTISNDASTGVSTITWTASGADTTYTITGAASDANALLIIPQLIGDNARVTVTYDMTFTNYGSDPLVYSNQVASVPLKTSTLTEWAVNTKYTYNLVVGLDKIEFTSTVADWVEGANINLGE